MGTVVRLTGVEGVEGDCAREDNGLEVCAECGGDVVVRGRTVDALDRTERRDEPDRVRFLYDDRRNSPSSSSS